MRIQLWIKSKTRPIRVTFTNNGTDDINHYWVQDVIVMAYGRPFPTKISDSKAQKLLARDYPSFKLVPKPGLEK